MKRAGFTMIELIFVIVILGILAAVAVPRLTATRQDALDTAMVADYKTAMKTINGSALATGAMPDFTDLFQAGGNIANVAQRVLTIGTGNTAATICATITADNTDVNITTAFTVLNPGCTLLANEVAGVTQVLGRAVTR